MNMALLCMRIALGNMDAWLGCCGTDVILSSDGNTLYNWINAVGWA